MTTDPTDSLPELIGGHYRTDREIGHGGMATVYLCTDLNSGEQAAVKVLRPELGSVVTKERFFREIQFASELEHPRIPRVLESGTTEDLPYYAMDYVEGESLRERMRREPKMPVDEVVRIAMAITSPMAYAHDRGIIHRDIKPENVLLHGGDVYVLDFGVARAIIGATGERLTRTGITVGTPAYMSPEQVTADRDLDLRSDIYSLGCVVYEMLAGAPPFRGVTPQMLMASRFTTPPKSLRTIRDDVPEALERAIAKSMEREPLKRWQSAEEFAAALKTGAEKASSTADGDDEDLLSKLKKTFADNYNVDEELKGGGMSRLFFATDKALNRRVVIKILPPEMVSQMMLARFRRESEVTARLQHPHILPVISAGVRDGLVHYIMPFIQGESLRARLLREGQLPINDAARLLREVTDALAYAHRQGVIHRDIKPENILIQDGHAILADFGIAAALSGEGGTESGPRLTGTGMSLGTVGYMAPEQALGEKTVDGRADIYAVGIVGYEMFAGTPPFTGATDQAILIAHLTRDAQSVDNVRKDTPPAIADAIEKAMKKDPAARFQTAAEFRDALEVPMTSPGMIGITSGFPARRLRKLSTKWKIGAPAAVAAVAIAIVVATKMRPPPSTSEGEGLTIAIAPFNTPSSGLKLWREGMVDMLARYLDGAGPLRTISPAVSIKGFPPASDLASATSLAKRTKAQYAIWGSLVGAANDSVTLRASLADVKTNTVWEQELRDSTAEAVAGKYTRAVLSHLNETHRLGAVKQSSFGSESIEALRAFLNGEQLFRRTSWDSAAVAYARAISFDGRFAIALRRAAQVAGWQRNGNDSAARAMWLKAGAENHGLAPRDSLLLLADSLSAALAPLRSDSMDWPKAARLFTTVNDAASRYPDDPEIWYAVGEARFHHGYGSPVNISERQSFDAFNRAIELDSAFAPAYVHAVELAFTFEGAKAGMKYTRAYLRLNPTDDEAEGISMVDKVASASGSNLAALEPILNRASSDAIMAAYFTIRRWPDQAQTAIRLLQATARRPHNSPDFATDSLRFASFLPLQLAYRGRLAEAYRVMGNRPSRLYVEMALLGGIHPDTASAAIAEWISKGILQAFYGLPWLAARGDSAQIRVLMGRADSASRVGSEFARRGAKYRAASTRAYLTLLRRDSALATKQFSALPDTLCIACYLDRLQAAKLLAARGQLDAADNLLGQRLNTLITPAEIMIAFERGRVAARLGKRDEAIQAFRLVVDAWSPGDPAVQRYVTEARQEAAKLGSR
ncbi:MAG: protein kinase [Gemmatimonadales bacterium]